MNLPPNLPHVPRSVVSLVPSLTETMFDLGFGNHLVGVTDYCIYPRDIPSTIHRVGGVQNPRIDEISRLQPDLILVNQEENSESSIETLMALGFPTWITFPKTCREVIEDLWKFVDVFECPPAAASVRSLEMAYEWAEMAASDLEGKRYFCPIWQQMSGPQAWWMTFTQETYCNDILRIAGGINIFAKRERHYPLEADLGIIDSEDPQGRDTRYPRVTLAEIQKADPEIILLPSEPYEYQNADQLNFQKIFPAARIVEIDGTLISWPGTRIGKALDSLNQIFAS